MADSPKVDTNKPASAPQPPQTLSAGTATEEPKTDELGFVAQNSDPRVEKGPFLVGRSDVGTHREITRADFESVGIDQDTLLFDWKKDFKIPLKDINPEAVKFLTENEYGFSTSDE